MRTKPATRRDPSHQHHQFGIYNWFRKSKGIKNKDVINEVVHAFCFSRHLDEARIRSEFSRFEFTASEFSRFAAFAGNYLKDNNYISSKSKKLC